MNDEYRLTCIRYQRLNYFNSLPDDKIVDLSKLKGFADNLNVNKKLKFVFEWVQKGENAGYQLFLLFSLCFQRISYTGSLKFVIIWYRVK